MVDQIVLAVLLFPIVVYVADRLNAREQKKQRAQRSKEARRAVDQRRREGKAKGRLRP